VPHARIWACSLNCLNSFPNLGGGDKSFLWLSFAQKNQSITNHLYVEKLTFYFSADQMMVRYGWWLPLLPPTTIVQPSNRVTGLDKFAPIGRFFTLGSGFKTTYVSSANFDGAKYTKPVINVLIFERLVGPHFGRLFRKHVRSPCHQTSFLPSMPCFPSFNHCCLFWQVRFGVFVNVQNYDLFEIKIFR
jgi:hypothetical protein